MELMLTRDSVHAADDVDAPHEVRPELAEDADLGDLVDWILRRHYLPLAGGGTWVLFLGARRGGRAAAIPGRPAAVISSSKHQPPEVAFILEADSPVAGHWWAVLAHGYRGGAQEVAQRWIWRPKTS
ncbi:MAG TPA: hypothetical protein VIP75_08835 [Acidothermales bacterium]